MLRDQHTRFRSKTFGQINKADIDSFSVNSIETLAMFSTIKREFTYFLVGVDGARLDLVQAPVVERPGALTRVTLAVVDT